ncbi:hypothetical protein C1H76_4603 [Elsinoe australis]|uniref:Uncharacterized protein n=1 Tax=Elsinoe australis TaxID=40998 RepID=A0A4U7B1D9_9PEZI|nr:hypothetical protein C1H76_4603 [Elsinoe australis]
MAGTFPASPDDLFQTLHDDVHHFPVHVSSPITLPVTLSAPSKRKTDEETDEPKEPDTNAVKGGLSAAETATTNTNTGLHAAGEKIDRGTHAKPGKYANKDTDTDSYHQSVGFNWGSARFFMRRAEDRVFRHRKMLRAPEQRRVRDECHWPSLC